MEKSELVEGMLFVNEDSHFIYALKNTENNKMYIGRTYNTVNRLKEHITLLKNNKHFNEKLQSDFNKYGIDKFDFEVLDFTDDSEDAIDSELKLIKKYSALGLIYNSAGTDEFNSKISEWTKCGLSHGRKGGRKPIDKQIIDRAIKLYESKKYFLREIEEMTGISRMTLYRALKKKV